MFLATVNSLETIPPALRDRLEIISLAGYTREEKKHIANDYLVPKQLEEHGLKPDVAEITTSAVEELIDSYTREAGVRNLEREVGSVVRGVAVKIAEGASDKFVIEAQHVEEYLGPQKFENDVANRVAEPGVATGLAWTPVGGDILFIEATRMPGKGSLVLTGQLGDVMKESATAALSFVRAHTKWLGLEENFHEKGDIHIHVPAGATPKDGPSAGVTMFSALVSMLTGKAVRNDVAMSGEITLRGAVLPVGGIKEKVLAAHRAGVKRIVLPEKNKKDMIDVPDVVKSEVEFFFVKKVEELLPLVLTEMPENVDSSITITANPALPPAEA